MKIFTLIALLLGSLAASADFSKYTEIRASANDTYNAACSVEYPPIWNDDGKLIKEPIALTTTVINIPQKTGKDILTHKGVTYHVDYDIEKGVTPHARYLTLSTYTAGTKNVLNTSSISFRTSEAPTIQLGGGIEGPSFYCMAIVIYH